MKTEDIIYRVNRGYTMSIYGSSQAIHEEMLKDITFLLENNKQLILSGVSKRFTENKMDDAYDKGYNDGYATGSTIM